MITEQQKLHIKTENKLLKERKKKNEKKTSHCVSQRFFNNHPNYEYTQHNKKLKFINP